MNTSTGMKCPTTHADGPECAGCPECAAPVEAQAVAASLLGQSWNRPAYCGTCNSVIVPPGAIPNTYAYCRCAKVQTLAATQPAAVPADAELTPNEALQIVHDSLNVCLRMADTHNCGVIQNAVKKALAALASHSAVPVAQGEPVADVQRYATQLATAIWQKNYQAEAPQWQVLPDTYGALSQIDNMVTGMSRTAPVAPKEAQPVGLPHEIGSAFITLESNGEGRTIVLKFNQRADAYAVHSFLLKGGGRDYNFAATSEPAMRAGDALATVHAFLLGEGPLDGFHFGDSDTARPRKAYWWRAHLRAAMASQSAEGGA